MINRWLFRRPIEIANVLGGSSRFLMSSVFCYKSIVRMTMSIEWKKNSNRLTIFVDETTNRIVLGFKVWKKEWKRSYFFHENDIFAKINNIRENRLLNRGQIESSSSSSSPSPPSNATIFMVLCVWRLNINISFHLFFFLWFCFKKKKKENQTQTGMKMKFNHTFLFH